jgi:hypothetical protein
VLSYEICRRFGGTYCVHFQDPRVSQTHMQHGMISLLPAGYLLCVLLDLEDGGRTLLRSVGVFLALLASLTLLLTKMEGVSSYETSVDFYHFCFLLSDYLVFVLTMKTESVCSSEMSVNRKSHYTASHLRRWSQYMLFIVPP